MQRFLFLEITDRDINYLLSGIETEITGNRPERATHLTIRGPYKRKIDQKTIDWCKEEMKGAVLRIEGVGRFSNPAEEVVYFEVDSPAVRRIWWKPDFPIRDYDFNPHISIYRGGSTELADKIQRFFEHENIALNCAEFKLVTHVSKQVELFPRDVPRALVATGRVSVNLLDRLRQVVLRHSRVDESRHQQPQGKLFE